VLTLFLASPALAADKKPAAATPDKPGAAAPAAPAAPKADADKALNAMGLTLAKSIQPFHLTKAEVDKVLAGMREGLGSAEPKQKMDQAAQENIRAFLMARMEQVKTEEKKKSDTYVEQQAKAKGAVKTANGSVIIAEKEGTGATPGPTDKVKVNYEGKTVDGKVFDASSRHGGPAEFNLGGGVIPCWTEALQKMKVGGKAKVVCPPSAAYGEQPPSPDIPPNAALTFSIELLETSKPPPPPPTPAAPGTPAGPQVTPATPKK
jgi:FKBP-type peptidyl-prolyl cis-trans isomerase